MGYAGLKKDGNRADLIAYLASMSDNPVPFPAVDAVTDAAEVVTEEVAETANH